MRKYINCQYINRHCIRNCNVQNCKWISVVVYINIKHTIHGTRTHISKHYCASDVVSFDHDFHNFNISCIILNKPLHIIKILFKSVRIVFYPYISNASKVRATKLGWLLLFQSLQLQWQLYYISYISQYICEICIVLLCAAAN